VKRLVVTIAITTALMSAAPAAADWSVPVGSNVVADQVIAGGGYPVPPGATRPDAGTCRAGLYDSNRSESWIAVQPGTESLVGTSKLFFETFSTFYDFHLGAFAIQNGAVTGASQVQGYDCVSTGTQAMPPTSTQRAAPTRRRCRSTRSGREVYIRTARSTCPTRMTSAGTGSRATAAATSSPTTTRPA
jgi:hypothetical protein